MIFTYVFARVSIWITLWFIAIWLQQRRNRLLAPLKEEVLSLAEGMMGILQKYDPTVLLMLTIGGYWVMFPSPLLILLFDVYNRNLSSSQLAVLPISKLKLQECYLNSSPTWNTVLRTEVASLDLSWEVMGSRLFMFRWFFRENLRRVGCGWFLCTSAWCPDAYDTTQSRGLGLANRNWRVSN
jgi:hypothetical protein